CATLQHTHSGPDVALEQERERVLTRAPVLVLPAEVAAEERQVPVQLVVRLVPPLRLRHRDPAVDLAPLVVDPRQPVVEQPWDPLFDGIASAALWAGELAAALVERAPADGTAEDLEQLHRGVLLE